MDDNDVAQYGRPIARRPQGEMGIRVQVLRTTLDRLSTPRKRQALREQALSNVERWAQEMAEPQQGDPPVIGVCRGDWGDVCLNVTQRFGTVFAVLNMANAYVPGGAYVEGTAAQEENMYRRTDCHFYITDAEYDRGIDRYNKEMTDLLNAKNGRVYLDSDNPRVCIRGSEDRSNRQTLGYPWLEPEEIFPFYELRAAAMDLRKGGSFSKEETLKRVGAQFDTLIDHNVRHVVLSAHGCGAFMNPASQVALCYKEALDGFYQPVHTELSGGGKIEQSSNRIRKENFDVIIFAIFHAGYGPDNAAPFEKVFGLYQNDE